MLAFSHTRPYPRCAVLALMVCCFCAPTARAFILGNPSFTPWTTTASGTRSAHGQPVTLTWSIVGDGTSTPDETGGNRIGSDLISFLDATFGGTPTPQQAGDLTARPWFGSFEQTFDRWEELSGIDFVYEPNDDGGTHSDKPGLLGVRGDIRIGGVPIDGAGGTLPRSRPDVGLLGVVPCC